jgi:hypothetical protein
MILLGKVGAQTYVLTNKTQGQIQGGECIEQDRWYGQAGAERTPLAQIHDQYSGIVHFAGYMVVTRPSCNNCDIVVTGPSCDSRTCPVVT